MPKVAFDELVGFGSRLLVKLGADARDAEYMARVATTTEAGEVHTHGVVIFSAFADQVGKGIDPAARPAVISERPAAAAIDGLRCFSPLAMRLAIDMAIAKAKALGIAMVGVRNTCWLGGLASYLLPVVEAGYFAQLWVQSSQCQDSVPVGGTQARFSTNPVALAIPTGGQPILADFSTAIYSMGKVGVMARKGQRAPEPVFFDKTGKSTDDPNAVRDGGGMLMAGGLINEHKGYSFSLWVEALTAMAGGNCNDPSREQRQSFNLTVIDPAAFGHTDYYRQEMTRFVAHVRSSRPRPGVDRIRLPGERMLDAVARSKREGVTVETAVLDRLDAAAARHGLPPVKRMS